MPFVLFTLMCVSISMMYLTGDHDKKPVEESKASELLSHARAARAVIHHFPGFTADLEIKINHKQYHGTVQVDSKGIVTVMDVQGQPAVWVKKVLTSTITHRLQPVIPRQTPCNFADEVTSHPLGRLINILNDEMHSSYRIRDNQIMEVNRQQGEGKFSIIVQENRRNEEGKFLPTSFTVQYWGQDGSLERSEVHHQTWIREQGLDLPKTIRVVTVTQSVDARELELTNFKLNHQR
jgi:hypothetical protein